MMSILALALWPGSAFSEIPLHPPAQFAHPYPGPVEIHRIDAANVYSICRGHRTVAGCQWFAGDLCVIIVATRSRRASAEDILAHENGHCNGWRH
jgi:hypothetical protein